MPSSLPCSRWASISAASRLLAARDRVDVAGEMEVQVLHRHDLRVAAAGRAALDPEDRAERRLAEREHRLPADAGRAPASSETDVVVFPSPAGVGVIAVTLTIFPSGRSARRSRIERSTFAL